MNKKEFIIWLVERDFDLGDIICIIEELKKKESIVRLVKGHPVRFAYWGDEKGEEFWALIYPSLKSIKKNMQFVYDVVVPNNPDSELDEDYFEPWERTTLINWFANDEEDWPLNLNRFDDAQMVNELGDVKSFD